MVKEIYISQIERFEADLLEILEIGLALKNERLTEIASRALRELEIIKMEVDRSKIS